MTFGLVDPKSSSSTGFRKVDPFSAGVPLIDRDLTVFPYGAGRWSRRGSRASSALIIAMMRSLRRRAFREVLSCRRRRARHRHRRGARFRRLRRPSRSSRVSELRHVRRSTKGRLAARKMRASPEWVSLVKKIVMPGRCKLANSGDHPHNRAAHQGRQRAGKDRPRAERRRFHVFARAPWRSSRR